MESKMTNAEIYEKNRAEDRARFKKWLEDHYDEWKASSDEYYRKLEEKRNSN